MKLRNGDLIRLNVQSVCVIVLGVLINSCVKEEPMANVTILGHAGIALSPERALFPPNTIESYTYALEALEADGVEVDVQLSSDGTLFCFHDQNMLETTGFDGCLNDLPASEIKELNYYKKNTIALLQTIIPLTVKKGHFLYLDLKHFNSCLSTFVDFDLMKEALGLVFSDLSETELSQVVLNSRSIDLLIELEEIGCPLAFETNDSELAKIYYENGHIDFAATDLQKMETEDKEKWMASSVPYVIFGMKTKKDLRELSGLVPKMVITDNIPATKRKYN